MSNILDHIEKRIKNENTELFLENKIKHFVSQAKSLFSLISETYDPETSKDLIKRTILSIKDNNSSRIEKGFNIIKESKEKANDKTNK